MAAGASSSKRRSSRVRLTFAQKLKVVEYVRTGRTHKEAAEQFKVARTTVSKIMQQQVQLKRAVASGRKGESRKTLLQAKCKLLDDILHAWHMMVEVNAPSVSVTGSVLQAKALHLRDIIIENHGDALPADVHRLLQLFQASNGRVQKYINRVGTRSIRRAGEHASVNQADIAPRLQQIRQALDGHSLSNIVNLDEMGLLGPTTSSRSYVTIKNDERGVKSTKERITVTPVVTAAGDKLLLQVIGKSKCPGRSRVSISTAASM